MWRTASLGLLWVLAGAGLAPAAARTEPVEREVIASAEPCLNLHAEPDSKSALVRCLASGRRMNLLESREGWARVRLADAEEGWVLFRHVRPAISSPGRDETAESRQIAKLESALAAAAIERTELQRGTSALRSEIYELRLANEELTALAAERAAAQSQAEQRLGELEAALTAAESGNESALAEATQLRDRLAEIESEALDREADVEDLAGRLEAAEKLLAEAETRRVESVRELEALWREEAALRKRAESERAQSSRADATLRAEVEGLRATNEQLLADARKVEIGRDEAERRIEELESALALAEAKGSEQPVSGSRLELLAEALGAVEAERSRLERQSRELESEVARLSDANEWLAMAVVERAGPVTVASAVSREYEGAQEPIGEPIGEPVAEPVSPPMLEPAEIPDPLETPEQPLSEAEPAVLATDARDATAAVEAWARAWSEQRVEDYLYFYSKSFEPADSSSREEWEALRRERVAGPEWIDVRLALADIRPLDDERMAVVFLQSYESNLMTDVVLKTLELVREDGGWKIVAERVE